MAVRKLRTKPETVLSAANAEDRRRTLVAMRTRIAKVIDDPDTYPRDLGTLTRRLMDITREIAELDAADPDGNTGGVVVKAERREWNQAAI